MKLLKVGRDNACDIRLASSKVSSLHAEIVVRDNGDIILTDKGSTNGTFLMNRPIVPGTDVSIKRGDMIRFADSELDWGKVPMPEDLSRFKAIYGIGSKLDNEIVLNGNTVSRYHATIKKDKNGKVFIQDHSTNGTTVNGNRIKKGENVRIKGGDAIVCGGVPVSAEVLKSIIPMNNLWKYVAGIAAAAAMVALIVLLAGNINGKYDSQKIYKEYNSAVCWVSFDYGYRISINDEDWTKRLTNQEIAFIGSYQGTGFFITNDGKIATNLHIARPWLYENATEDIAKQVRESLARIGASDPRLSYYTSLIPQVKVEGVLTDMYVVLNGLPNSEGNRIKCTEYKAYDQKDDERDVAIIQTETRRLPDGVTRIIDIKEAETSNETLTEGNKVFTIGFPYGSSIALTSNQELQNQIHEGRITQNRGEFEFGHDAATAGGASGSPILNERGHLIGIHHAGLTGVTGAQGFNMGIRAKYIVDLLNK